MIFCHDSAMEDSDRSIPRRCRSEGRGATSVSGARTWMGGSVQRVCVMRSKDGGSRCKAKETNEGLEKVRSLS